MVEEEKSVSVATKQPIRTEIRYGRLFAGRKFVGLETRQNIHSSLGSTMDIKTIVTFMYVL